MILRSVHIRSFVPAPSVSCVYEATYSCILHFAPFVTQKKSRRSKPQSSASAHLGFLRAVACWRQVGAAFFLKCE